MVLESVSKAMGEAGYDQYGEGMSISTDPSWFDTLAAPDEPARELKGTPEARKLVDAAKKKLRGIGNVDQHAIGDVATELEQEFNLPDDVSFDIVHAAVDELLADKMNKHLDPVLPRKRDLAMEEFTSLVRQMIREELKSLKEKRK